jgi:adenylate kinase
MKPQAFIFIGRSGCGKGTQLDLLVDALKKADPAHEVLKVQTGAEFRKLGGESGYTSAQVKKTIEQGKLMPEFMCIYVWGRVLAERYTGNEHLVFDGTPRKPHEAAVLDSVFKFYGFDKPWVINIDISSEEAMKRLLARKRSDDTEADIRERLSWYEEEVVPTLQYYDENERYRFLKVNGERSVEEIRADIVKRTDLA